MKAIILAATIALAGCAPGSLMVEHPHYPGERTNVLNWLAATSGQTWHGTGPYDGPEYRYHHHKHR